MLGLIRHGRYEEAADLIAKKLGPKFDELVGSKFGPIPEAARLGDAAVCLLPRIFGDSTVITTNFDDVVERVFRESRHPFESDEILRGLNNFDAVADSTGDSARFLIKLHGDATGSSRVLTREEYARAYGYGNRPSWKTPLAVFLRTLFARRSLLFLGCSLRKDAYLDLLWHVEEALAREGSPRSKSDYHVAIVPRPTGAVAQLRRIRELER